MVKKPFPIVPKLKLPLTLSLTPILGQKTPVTSNRNPIPSRSITPSKSTARRPTIKVEKPQIKEFTPVLQQSKKLLT